MSWTDTVKAKALAALSGRTVTSRRIDDTPWNWNPHDVWLKRVEQPHDRAARSSLNEQSAPPQPGAVPRD